MFSFWTRNLVASMFYNSYCVTTKLWLGEIGKDIQWRVSLELNFPLQNIYNWKFLELFFKLLRKQLPRYPQTHLSNSIIYYYLDYTILTVIGCLACVLYQYLFILYSFLTASNLLLSLYMQQSLLCRIPSDSQNMHYCAWYRCHKFSGILKKQSRAR